MRRNVTRRKIRGARPDGNAIVRIVDKSDITSALVSLLVAEQFPQWAGLPVRPVDRDGWDNATFRLGDQLSVRLPSARGYVASVAKEHQWLPELAGHLPLPIPQPLALGTPGCGYPFPWSVYRWLPGESAEFANIADQQTFAADLAGFLRALYRISPAGGPPPSEHNSFRGGSLTVYDSEARAAAAALNGVIDTVTALEIWEAALRATWAGEPVWVHGDVTPANLLVERGTLSAVIDFGSCAVGDPACDTVMTWIYFTGAARRSFTERLGTDPGTLARGRGWAIWKSMIVLVQALRDDPEDAAATSRVIAEIIADHQALG
jgi:aminoglycoside phosphotransferase (APT) family kinase protein